MRIGPESRRQFEWWRRNWDQSQHVLISGPTGTGKTTYIKQLTDIRLERGAYCIAYITKVKPDKTIEEEFRGWTRWSRWRKGGPTIHENRVLIMPNLKGLKTMQDIVRHQKEVFKEALDESFNHGKLTQIVDEGLHMAKFLGLGPELSFGYTQGRSNHLTYITGMQRPANVPVEVYGSASHAIIGQTRDADDLKRVRELGAKESAKELGVVISGLGPYEFLHIPARSNNPPVVMDLSR